MFHSHEFATRRMVSWTRRPGVMTLMFSVPAVIGAAFFSADVVSRTYDLSIFQGEKDRAAPIDRGNGPAATGASGSKATSAAPLAAAVAPTAFGGLGQTLSGGSALGKFGAAIPWPIIPIHVSLLPDGRVLSFGTDKFGNQGSTLWYDIWDPSKGVDLATSHTTLPNGTPTDIFCGTGTWIPTGLNNSTLPLTGKYLSLGGDLTVNGVRNFANDDIVIFDPGTASNPTSASLRSAGDMAFPRWYATMQTRPNGEKLLLGGMLNPSRGVVTPEVFKPSNNSFRQLTTAKDLDMDYYAEWYYPRVSTGRDGLPYILHHFSGKISRLDPNGTGTLTNTFSYLAPSSPVYPTIALPVRPNYPPFRTLTIRSNKRAQIVDLNNSVPVVTEAPSLRYDRKWGTFTLLANGNVLLTGGSSVENSLTDVHTRAEIYWPVQGIWTLADTASKPRLYHSATLLLPDGSVLTGGGGAPGPVKNLNAEIFYPPYLYKPDGTPAPRPTIVTPPPTSVKLNQFFSLAVKDTDQIGRITLVRAGNQTHSYDPDARVIYPAFAQNGPNISVYIPYDAKVVPPGYYMLFVFSKEGYPSIAKFVTVQQSIQ